MPIEFNPQRLAGHEFNKIRRLSLSLRGAEFFVFEERLRRSNPVLWQKKLDCFAQHNVGENADLVLARNDERRALVFIGFCFRPDSQRRRDKFDGATTAFDKIMTAAVH